jgi:phage-related protein
LLSAVITKIKFCAQKLSYPAEVKTIKGAAYHAITAILWMSHRERAGAFRVIYVASFGNVVYVLHAFQKKTQQTAKRDVELAASRSREQMARRR